MSKSDPQLNLLEVINQLVDAAGHLKISHVRCLSRSKHDNNEDELIEYEALTSRFARAVDILIHKIYRSIDTVEFTSGGTLIDVMNRAEKRKLVDSVREMHILKDLRNDISHEYLPERLQLIHQEVLERTPKLIDLIERAVEYSKKYR